MNVLFSINDCFVEGFLATAVSFCIHNSGHHDFYVTNDGLLPKNQKKILKILSRQNVTVFFVEQPSSHFGSPLYSSLPRYSPLSLNRLLPQLALPETVHRALYLDSDLIINGPLNTFYDTPLTGFFLAAVCVRRDGQDGGPYWDQEANVYNDLRVALKPGNDYFNAGVLLLNLDKFREIDESHYDKIVLEQHNNITLLDQDILNLAFEDEMVHLCDRRLNCTIPENMRLRRGEYHWIKKEAVVIHYVVKKKPWMPFRYRNPLFKIFMHYFWFEKRPFSFFTRYTVWFFMKPFHFLAHCWRKGMSLLFKHQ
jgi:Lipopolysaccharide biosynthesis proteins, LPS:glycosyltransferases